MFAARLMVERGSFRDKSQDWGVYAFLSAPSPGDRVAAAHEDTTHYLTVISVHHKPVPLANDGGTGGETPSADVVAKWTGSD
ncbi:hypothetical protein [Mesorhizobium sp. CAU 1741]|uniref:hypothetical protein n=1 Tax=Mesorhizobium sp. CAU 1741 TaxID=3140366 RepID=UPI00325BF334